MDWESTIIRLVVASVVIHMLLSGFAFEALSAAMDEATKASLSNYWQTLKGFL